MNNNNNNRSFSSVAEEIHHLLQQESDLLYGLEDHIERITSKFNGILLGDKDAEEVAVNTRRVMDAFILNTARQKQRGFINKIVFSFNYLLARNKAINKMEAIEIDIIRIINAEMNSLPSSSNPIIPNGTSSTFNAIIPSTLSRSSNVIIPVDTPSTSSSSSNAIIPVDTPSTSSSSSNAIIPPSTVSSSNDIIPNDLPSTSSSSSDAIIPIDLPSTSSSSSSTNYISSTGLVGRENHIQAIEEMLISSSGFSVISVVGIGGVGKTVLAKKIYGRVKSHFDCLAWVHLSTYPETKDLFEEIGERIMGLKKKQSVPEEETKSILYNFLMKKRYFIVLDDVEKTQEWDCLEGAIPMDALSLTGSRILLTTRSNEIAIHAMRRVPGAPDPYILGGLSIDESWELFTKTIQVLPTSLSPDLISIGANILKKCEGLPLAIRLIGGLLKEGSESRWLKILNILLQDVHKPKDITSTESTIDLSISRLPFNLKQCLFYLVFFPRNYELHVRRLFALWVAEGFVKPSNDEPLEYIAVQYLKVLLNFNLIEVVKYRTNGEPKTIRVHGLIHETLLSNAKQANHVNSMYSSSGGIRRLADYTENFEAQRNILLESYIFLLSFLSFDYREGFAPGEKIRHFFHGGINKGYFVMLRVLDLEGVYKPGLPKELGRLINLRYIGLRWTYIDTLPSSIHKLFNLQTLDIKHTFIDSLPASIWKMQQLRHLYLNETHLGRFKHIPTCSLRNLQTLLGAIVDDESTIENGLDRLTDLTSLGLTCDLTSEPQRDAMAKWISKLESLQSLKLTSKDQLGKLSQLRLMPVTNHKHLTNLYLLGRLERSFKVHDFSPYLIELTLSASILTEDPMPTLGMLSKLTILKLYSDSYIGKSMVCSSSGFIQLQVLKIWKLKQLEEWVVEDGSMPVLRMLDIRACISLSKLPVRLQEITTLEELKISNMPKEFTAVVEQNKDMEWYKKANVCFIDWETSSSEAASSSSS